MKSYYYLIITLEIEVPKTSLTLGYLDEDGSIKEYALEQLLKLFPSDLYDCTELLGSYVFSIKTDLKAKQFLKLRDMALKLMDVEFDYLQESEEKRLKKELKNASVSEMIKISQPRMYDFNQYYNNYRWKEYGASLQLYSRRDESFSGYASVTCKGIQIYKSNDYFTTESSGVLWIITDPLRSALKKIPYSNLLSARIGDEHI